MNGNSSPAAWGTVVDPSNAGTAIGIALQSSNIPVMLFMYNNNGVPLGVDVNGDGIQDYYFCFSQSTVTLRTGINCSGNQVLVFPGQGYDTNGDGAPDNLILSSIVSDTVAPSSVISPNSGTYGGQRTVTVVCSDNVAPGDIAYTTDGTNPSFSPLVGRVYDAPSTSFTVGTAGDGTYTVKYFCRDMAGNSEVLHIAAYQINHNVPNITFVSGLSSPYVSVNSGAVPSSSFSWQSNQSGSYTIRQNATGCSDGTIIGSGTVTANTTVPSSISASQLSAGLNSIYICVAAGLTGSLSFNISRDDIAPSASTSPGAGVFGTSPQNISLSCIDTSSCTVAYTTDGTVPAINSLSGTVTNGLTYSGTPIALSGGTTAIQFIARDGAGNLSGVNSATYTINTSVATITVNSVTPQSISASVSSNVTVVWQSSSAGTYQVLVGGTDCTSGSLAGGTNVGGNAAAATPITSVLNNSNFANGSNTVRICVANASIAPQYGSSSFIVTKDSVAPTIQSSTPANGSFGVSPSSASATIVFSEPMNTSLSQLPASYVNACPASSSGTVYFEADLFDGSSFNCTDVTAVFTWLNGGTNLQINLSWLAFPENTKIQFTIPAASLTDAAGNPLAAASQIVFTTAPNQKKFPILQSGQTACWDANGNPVPCSGTGQDGNIQFGSVRNYLVTATASTSIIQDSVTGLVWKTCATPADWEIKTGACTKNSTTIVGPWTYSVDNSGTPSKFSGLNACSVLNASSYGGISTWRLPTLAELATISKYGSGASPAIDTSAFTNPTSGQSSNYWVNFWSATGNAGNGFYAWALSLSDGSVSPITKPNANQVFCVSGLNSTAVAQGFSVNNANGTVTDNATGLIWESCTAGLSGSSCSTGTAITYTWQNALSRCNALTTAGKSWRLPNVNELRSLVDYSKSSPAIDTTSFPGTVSSYYWTSTSYAQSPLNAWYVYFANGQMNPYTAKSSAYYVRCVTN
ncbi:DUF1566 domain-containing protein [Leptospira fluminis]|uniref:Lcl domain-containing protein n=1 Tax=Leptospira fluminis TaxID=2484979 RepID=UPI00143B9C49|nr:DUF1566 domain-containing protein [Leptospira fluminis]